MSQVTTMTQAMTVTTIDPWALPSMPVVNYRRFPNCPCIYFAVKGCHVLYIGKAYSGLATRWKGHHRLAQLAKEGGVNIAWLEMNATDDELFDLEVALINHYDPPLNFNSKLGKRHSAKDPAKARGGGKRVTIELSPSTFADLDFVATQKGMATSRHIGIIIETHHETPAYGESVEEARTHPADGTLRP